MAFPVQVSFQQMPPSPALRARIRDLAARLERFSPNILRCRVRVERPAQHKQQGALHDIRIDVSVPDEQIVVRHSHPVDHAHEDVYVALRDAFNAARRQLENYERKRRGKIKRRGGAAQPAPKPRKTVLSRGRPARQAAPVSAQSESAATPSAAPARRR